MADIELVIKVPEEMYQKIKEGEELGIPLWLAYEIVKGTPLPKGHGRLIDADVLEKDIEDYSEGAFAMTPEFLVKDALTIIEADEESEEYGMSGGSYNYICYKLEGECKGAMYDAEMNDLIVDLCGVLHDLEWWQSCDISEEAYRKTLSAFKKKWFKGDREQRQKEQQPSKDDCLKASYEVIGRYEDEVKDLKAQLDTVVKTMNDRIEAANLHSKELCDRVHKKIDKTIDEQTRMENEITHLRDTDIKALESKIDSFADRVWKVEIKNTDAKLLFSKVNDRIKAVDEGLSSLKREVLEKVEPDIRQLYFEDLPRIEKLETKVSTLEFDTQKLLAEMSKMSKDLEHDFRITCSTEEPRCIDCIYSEENGKSCSANGCICYSKFTPKEKGD